MSKITPAINEKEYAVRVYSEILNYFEILEQKPHNISESDIETDCNTEQVLYAITCLSDIRKQQILRYRFHDGMEFKDIAQLLNLSKNYTYSLCRKAIVSLSRPKYIKDMSISSITKRMYNFRLNLAQKRGRNEEMRQIIAELKENPQKNDIQIINQKVEELMAISAAIDSDTEKLTDEYNRLTDTKMIILQTRNDC